MNFKIHIGKYVYNFVFNFQSLNTKIAIIKNLKKKIRREYDDDILAVRT